MVKPDRSMRSLRSKHSWPAGPTILLLIVAAGICSWARGRGYKTLAFRLFNPEYGVHHYPPPDPSITQTRPADRDGNVLPTTAFVAADVDLPYAGQVVDGATLNAQSVKLYRTADTQAVPAVVNTSGAGDAIVLRPMQTLLPSTEYTFEVTAAAKDTGGHAFKPYTAHFWTAAGQQLSEFPAAFEQIKLPTTSGHMYTCVTVGPDHRLYASTLAGEIFSFAIDPAGMLSDTQLIDAVNQANHRARLITGITFDPAARADELVLWVSHGELPPRAQNGQGWIVGANDWTGKISRLSGARLQDYQDVVVGLPRGWKDHLNNQIAFGPDRALYFCQAANTAMGAPDAKWGMRAERLLTAAILRLDPAALESRPLPLDVKTEEGGTYDPFAPGAPLTIYASGIRNSFDLLWHRNGHLYAGINGSAAGGNTPATPPAGADAIHRLDTMNGPYRGPAVGRLTNVRETEDDMLFNVERGAYYGHPNPTRAEYVLNGGNPAPHDNPYQVSAYPLGTQPDRNWHRAIFSFGKNLSPCGVIEYHDTAFHGAMEGKVLYVRYSGGDDILALALDREGNVAESIAGIDGLSHFINPVDLTEDLASGNIYVAEFGAKRITLLSPRAHGSDTAVASQHVCRVQLQPTSLTSGRD